jgi:hypothetical protein
MFEGPSVVLTSHRLMANFGRGDDGAFDEAPLADIAPPRKYNGGKHSHKSGGARLLLAGAAVLGIEVLLESVVGLAGAIAAVLFLVGNLGVLVGLYYIIGGLFQVKPNTTLVFPKVDGGQIIVPFAGWDSPDAEELTRQFARAKRGF